MPAISTAPYPLSNDNSPHTSNLSTTIDLAVLLSEYYGKNIRQGQTFKINAAQATVRPAAHLASAGVDVGISTVTTFKHLPTTKHSRKAWNSVFTQWSRQKQLASAVGSAVRYDDMEFAWNSSSISAGRTSTIHGQGLAADESVEHLCLTGDSTEGTDFCLSDYYNSLQPAPGPSLNHFDGTTIKASKFGTTKFPESQSFSISGTNSTAGDYDGIDELHAAISMNDVHTFPSPVNVFCGLLRANTFVMPDDTLTQTEEDMEIIFTFFISSFKPLVYPRRKGKSRGSSRRKSGSRRSRSGRRRPQRRKRRS